MWSFHIQIIDLPSLSIFRETLHSWSFSLPSPLIVECQYNNKYNISVIRAMHTFNCVKAVQLWDPQNGWCKVIVTLGLLLYYLYHRVFRLKKSVVAHQEDWSGFNLWD